MHLSQAAKNLLTERCLEVWLPFASLSSVVFVCLLHSVSTVVILDYPKYFSIYLMPFVPSKMFVETLARLCAKYGTSVWLSVLCRGCCNRGNILSPKKQNKNGFICDAEVHGASCQHCVRKHSCIHCTGMAFRLCGFSCELPGHTSGLRSKSKGHT